MGPRLDELEISVFGRGYGEAILIHVGSNNWIAIDSLHNSSKKPVTLSYLEEIGVSPAQIVLIIATHWHDDHVKGISEILQVSPNAKFAISIAMQRDEWLAFARDHSNVGSERFTSGVEELRQAARIARIHGRKSLFCGPNRILYREPGTSFAHGRAVSVEALSPADEDIQDFLLKLTSYSNSPIRRVEPFSRNDVSVATIVKVGDISILLGADLEVNQSGRGWDAVLESATKPDAPASIFKIPHHGSENGHHPEVWASMLESEPLSVLTSWNRGTKLPTKEDVERILALSRRSYCTSRLRTSPRRRPGVVDNQLRDMGVKISRRPDNVGQVRIRRIATCSEADWHVDLVGGAATLEDFYKTLLTSTEPR